MRLIPLVLAALMLSQTCYADTQDLAPLPPIENSALVNAPIAEVWNAWTTSQGIPTFLGLGAEVDTRPRGVFRVVFEPQKTTPLERGNDGIIVAIEHQRMLAVTWMTPMHMAALRGNSTSLVLYFEEADGGKRTLVRLFNSGYGTGPDWRAAYDYNVKGWDRVLSGLEYRFETGPIDWDLARAELKSKGAFPWWRELRQKNGASQKQ